MKVVTTERRLEDLAIREKAINDPSWHPMGRRRRDGDDDAVIDATRAKLLGEIATERAALESDAARPRVDAVAIDLAVASVAAFVADAESRPVLAHVCLRNGKAVAADGFALAIADLPAPVRLVEGDGASWVPADRLDGEHGVLIDKAVAVAARKAVDPRGAVLAEMGAGIAVADAALRVGSDVHLTETIQAVHGGGTVYGDDRVTYPDETTILPTSDPVATVAIAAGYLQRVGKFMAEVGERGKGTPVHIDVRERGSAIVFRADGQVGHADTRKRGASVVVMPMVVGTYGTESSGHFGTETDGLVRSLRSRLDEIPAEQVEHRRQYGVPWSMDHPDNARRAALARFLAEWDKAVETDRLLREDPNRVARWSDTAGWGGVDDGDDEVPQ